MPTVSKYPSLERSPGKSDNWVEQTGGLPAYIDKIARSLHYERGMTIGRAIATAVEACRKWAAGGGNVNADTRAKAAAALAEWEAKKAASKAKRVTNLSQIMDDDGQVWIDLTTLEGDEWELVDLAPGTGHPPYHWKHGYIPITPAAALSKAKGNKTRAAKLLVKGGSRPKIAGERSRSTPNTPATTPMHPATTKAADDAARGRASSPPTPKVDKPATGGKGGGMTATPESAIGPRRATMEGRREARQAQAANTEHLPVGTPVKARNPGGLEQHTLPTGRTVVGTFNPAGTRRKSDGKQAAPGAPPRTPNAADFTPAMREEAQRVAARLDWRPDGTIATSGRGGALDRLKAAGMIEPRYVGTSAAHDDHYVITAKGRAAGIKPPAAATKVGSDGFPETRKAPADMTGPEIVAEQARLSNYISGLAGGTASPEDVNRWQVRRRELETQRQKLVRDAMRSHPDRQTSGGTPGNEKSAGSDAAKAQAAGRSAGGSGAGQVTTPTGQGAGAGAGDGGAAPKLDESAARRMSDDQLEQAVSRLASQGAWGSPAMAVLEKELDRRDQEKRAPAGQESPLTKTADQLQAARLKFGVPNAGAVDGLATAIREQRWDDALQRATQLQAADRSNEAGIKALNTVMERVAAAKRATGPKAPRRIRR